MTITIFGGSGFVGRHVVKRLALKGHRVRVACRDVEAAKFLKPLGDLGQIALMKVNVLDRAAVERAVSGADAVLNLVAVLAEAGAQRFQALHVDAARDIAELSAAHGVRRLVHMSALGADRGSRSAYARSKGEGESAVRAAFPEAVIVRPSVVFGPEDGFFNRFASIAALSPILPYFASDIPRILPHAPEGGRRLDLDGDGGPKFQPVYVGDVADALVACLTRADVAGKTFELGGPVVMTMREVMELVRRETRRSVAIVGIPMWKAAIMAFFAQALPKPPITPDQVRLLRQDNTVSGSLPGLADLGITPTTAEAIVPTYLDRFRTAHRHTIIREGTNNPRAR